MYRCRFGYRRGCRARICIAARGGGSFQRAGADHRFCSTGDEEKSDGKVEQFHAGEAGKLADLNV